MKKNKKKKLIWLITIAVVLVASSSLLALYLTKNDKSYSYSEKKWINENANKVVDIYVESGLPVFSNNGSGVFYDYLTSLEKDTGITFNIIYENTAKYSFSVKSNENNSITFFKDHYVVIGKENRNIASLDYLKDLNVGVLTSDLNAVRQHLSDYNILYKGYNSFDDIKAAFSSGTSQVAIVPLYLVIADIIAENYVISYHIDGFNAYYSLNLSNDNEALNGIMEKFYNRWSSKSEEKRNEHLVSLYYKTKGYTEIEKNEIINDDYAIGYINNLPFEGTVNNTFTGLTGAYLYGFSKFSGVTYKYNLYKSVDELQTAFNNNQIDISANYYSISAKGFSSSKNFKTGEYVVLTHVDNPLALDTLSTLSGASVEMLGGMNLTAAIKNRKVANVIEHNTSKEMFKNLDEDSIVIVEKEFYEYYKNNKFKNYVIKYSSTLEVNNSFLLNDKNEALNKLFNFYMTLNSDSEMRSLSTQKLYGDTKNNIILSFIINNVVYVSASILVVGLILYRILRKTRLSKKIKKEDKLLYIDVMTNLKNRNYLNDNINSWSESKVYPQTILILDLNRIKDLNDKYGHEEGDNQIKAAANALIKTQRENSEIMRTDGNEFMVYFIGYEEKAIVSYIHKLTRELNASLPYKDYGVALGYSMITSELNSIDDAINDASKIMRKNKGVSGEEKN